MMYTKEEFNEITSTPCKSIKEVVERRHYIYEYWRHNHIDTVRSVMQAEWFGVKEGYVGRMLKSAEEIMMAITNSPISATVNLHRDQCDHWKFYADFIPGKELAVWQPGNKWNATSRNRLNHARENGYFDYDGGFGMWNLHREDIFKINTSAKERQGREMNPEYFKYPEEKTIINTCPFHQYRLILVRYENRVLAYAVVHIAGELMNISTILGHAEFLKDGIMLPLMDRIQKTAIEHGVKFVTYYLWESGLPGLQYFKHSTGFKPLELSE